MGKGGGSSQPQYVSAPTNTTTTQNPWSGQEPYLKEIFGQAQTDYSTPLQFYGGNVPGVPTGQTYAPFSPDSLAAMALTEQQALTNPIPQAATDYSQKMLSGDYLSAGNPYFSNMVQNISNTVRPQVESTYSKAGRYGSGAMDKAFASAMTDTAGQLAYQNYGDTMKNMSQAAYLAPQTAELGYQPAEKISGVGGMLEDQTQNAINQAMSNWQFSQMEPWQRLGLYAGDVQGNYGGTATSTGTTGQWINPGSSNTAGNVIGGLSSLGGLGMLAYSLFSDKRTKENIKPVGDGILETIMRLDPVTFDYKPEFGKKDQIGFVADDLEKEFPNLVSRHESGMRMVAPFGLIPVLVKGMQEQQEQIEQLRGTV